MRRWIVLTILMAPATVTAQLGGPPDPSRERPAVRSFRRAMRPHLSADEAARWMPRIAGCPVERTVLHGGILFAPCEGREDEIHGVLLDRLVRWFVPQALAARGEIRRARALAEAGAIMSSADALALVQGEEPELEAARTVAVAHRARPWQLARLVAHAIHVVLRAGAPRLRVLAGLEGVMNLLTDPLRAERVYRAELLTPGEAPRAALVAIESPRTCLSTHAPPGRGGVDYAIAVAFDRGHARVVISPTSPRDELAACVRAQLSRFADRLDGLLIRARITYAPQNRVLFEPPTLIAP